MDRQEIDSIWNKLYIHVRVNLNVTMDLERSLDRDIKNSFVGKRFHALWEIVAGDLREIRDELFNILGDRF